MSGSKLGPISKGKVHEQLDNSLNDTTNNYDRRIRILEALQGAEPTARAYLNILQNRDLGRVKADDVRYLDRTWYNEEPGGWWPSLQPIHLIIRQGLIKAIEEAGRNRDIDSYWIPVGNQIETIVTKSAKQVTRLILTPPRPIERSKAHDPAHPPRRDRHADIWVARRGSGQEPPEETLDEVVEKMQGNIVIWRVKEFSLE